MCSWSRHKTKISARSPFGRTDLFEWRCSIAAEPILVSALALNWVSIEYLNVSFIGQDPVKIWSVYMRYKAQCDHFQQFYNRRNVKVHVPIIRWSHCVKLASALFSVTNSTSQWWKPSPWQNHSRKLIFNDWKLAIIDARTEIAGSLSSAWGTGTSCSCLNGSVCTSWGWEARMICSFPCRFRIKASKSSISSVAENLWRYEGAYTFNGNDSQRSETDFEIHIRVQRCLTALVAEAVELVDTGEGTIRSICTLSKHFNNLIFSVGLLLAGWQTLAISSTSWRRRTPSAFTLLLSLGLS